MLTHCQSFRNIPGSCHLPFHSPYRNHMTPLPVWANQHSTRQPAVKSPPPSTSTALRKPQNDSCTLTTSFRQEPLHRAPTRRSSTSRSPHLQAPDCLPTQVKQKKATPAIPLVPSYTYLAEPSPRQLHAGAGAVDSTTCESSSLQAAASGPFPRKTAHAGISDSTIPPGSIRRASTDNVSHVRVALSASARSRHLQQYLDTQPTSGQRATTAARDRIAQPDPDLTKGTSTNAERMQWPVARQASGPHLRSAFAELLPVDPLAAVAPCDRWTATNSPLPPTAAAAATVNKRPSTVPNMRSRLMGCEGNQEVLRPGTSAGVPCVGLTDACIGPWSSEATRRCLGTGDRSGTNKGDVDKGREKSSLMDRGGLGLQYAGWIWGPGSSDCLHNVKMDAKESSVTLAQDSADELACNVTDKVQVNTSSEQEEDASMLTCASVQVNALLMSQLSRAGDKRS